MAQKIVTVVFVASLLVLIFLANNNVGAQSNCPIALTSLAPCLTSNNNNNNGGNSSTPSASCCSELANLVQTAPSCICEALNIGGAQAVGYVLGQFLPTSLPGACNLQIPMNQCNGAVAGAGSGSGSDPNNGQGNDGTYSKATTMSKIPLLLDTFLITLLAALYLSVTV